MKPFRLFLYGSFGPDLYSVSRSVPGPVDILRFRSGGELLEPDLDTILDCNTLYSRIQRFYSGNKEFIPDLRGLINRARLEE